MDKANTPNVGIPTLKLEIEKDIVEMTVVTGQQRPVHVIRAYDGLLFDKPLGISRLPVIRPAFTSGFRSLVLQDYLLFSDSTKRYEPGALVEVNYWPADFRAHNNSLYPVLELAGNPNSVAAVYRRLPPKAVLTGLLLPEETRFYIDTDHKVFDGNGNFVNIHNRIVKIDTFNIPLLLQRNYTPAKIFEVKANLGIHRVVTDAEGNYVNYDTTPISMEQIKALYASAAPQRPEEAIATAPQDAIVGSPRGVPFIICDSLRNLPGHEL